MIRIAFSRSTWTTTNSRPRFEKPTSTHLYSRVECISSVIVSDKASPTTVIASSNDTPCFLRFDSAFCGPIRIEVPSIGSCAQPCGLTRSITRGRRKARDTCLRIRRAGRRVHAEVRMALTEPRACAYGPCSFARQRSSVIGSVIRKP